MATGAFKDFVTGRDVTLSDRVVDTMLQTLVGINRFQIYQARDIFGSESPYTIQQKANTLVGGTLIPGNFIYDIAADFAKVANGNMEGLEDISSVKDVPVAGKIIYWRLGEGAKKERKKGQFTPYKVGGSSNVKVVY